MAGAYRLHTASRKAPSITCKKAEAAFVLEEKVNPGKPLLRGFSYGNGLGCEVFLKASTASASFLTWLLRATLILVAKFLLQNSYKVVYLIFSSLWELSQSSNSL
jgi:hypothetical protein